MDNLANGPYDPRTIFCGEELVATIDTGNAERDVTYARAFVSAMNEAHALRAENERLRSPWQHITADPTDNPCADALDKLWQAIILKRNPDYGDWEYPGQAYRHLLAEYEELKADPWQQITADPTTLPLNEWMLLSLDRSGRGRENINVKAMWDGRYWRASGDWVIQEPFDGRPYAYQPWPTAAPYPGNEVNE